MATVYYRSRRGLNRFLEDHGPGGVAILADRPSRLIRATILVLFAALLAGVAWSFFGHADVVVEASGLVQPQSDQHGVFLPIKGDLVDVYATEGMPVEAGDVLMRINSGTAVEVAGQTATAAVQLAAAERTYASFPEKKKAALKELESLKAKLEVDAPDVDWRNAESIAKLAEEQQLKLDKARSKLAKAASERDEARRVLEQHERLFNSPGGGGLSRDQVEEKRATYRDKVTDYKLAETELGEFEVSALQEYDKRKAELSKKSQELLGLQGTYQKMLVQLAADEQQAETDVRLARARMRSANRITYRDIDEENYLRIRAPVSGIVTTILNSSNVGAQFDERTPVAAIAPKDARKILELQVNERDRAFLTAGMPVRIKVNAFPYQRYGVLTGEIEHISPVSNLNENSKQIEYKTRVALKQDYFVINGVNTPIRYGMAAKAEIVVNSRRLIELVIDPLKSAAG
jgi:HlyD family secretion protein